MFASLRSVRWLMIAGIVSVCLAPLALAEVTAEGDVDPEADDAIWGYDPGGDPVGVLYGGFIDSLIVGDTSTGRVIIDVPEFTDPLISPDAIIGNTATGIGLVQVEGFTSEWRMYAVEDPEADPPIDPQPGNLTVGYEGQGFVDIFDGGIVRVAAGEDEDGHSVGTPTTTMATMPFSQGIVHVADFGSLFQTGELTVAEAGIATILVQERGNVNSIRAIVGNQLSAFGEVIVEDLGSRWNNYGNLTLGFLGRGHLTVRNSGLVTIQEGDVGDGQLLVGNVAEDQSRGELHLESGGQVRVQISTIVAAGGLIDMAGGVLVTPMLNNYGVIRGDGRIEINTGQLLRNYHEIRNTASVADLRERLLVKGAVENSGRIESIGGEMEFELTVMNHSGAQIVGRDAIYRFGTWLESNTALVNDGTLGFSCGASDVFGQIESNGTIAIGNDTCVTFYDTVTNNGDLLVMPGGSAMFMEDLSLGASSTLSLGFGSASEEGLSQIQSADTITLSGSLDITLDGNFLPSPGDSFQIITGDSISGTFAAEHLPDVLGMEWQIDYLATSVVLSVMGTGTIAGDFNSDGTVNNLDLVVWQDHFGTTNGATTEQGDADGDGDVDGADFLIWQRHYGSTLGPSPLSAPVPEPNSMLLVLSTILLLSLRFARRSIGPISPF